MNEIYTNYIKYSFAHIILQIVKRSSMDYNFMQALAEYLQINGVTPPTSLEVVLPQHRLSTTLNAHGLAITFCFFETWRSEEA